MTDEQIRQKAKDIYIRFFDDDFEYSNVLHSLEICAEEAVAEATKELQEKLKHRNCVDCSNHSSKLRMRNLELEKRFSEAKEIIKEFFRITTVIDDDFEPDYSQLIEKAEAFIKE